MSRLSEDAMEVVRAKAGGSLYQTTCSFNAKEVVRLYSLGATKGFRQGEMGSEGQPRRKTCNMNMLISQRRARDKPGEKDNASCRQAACPSLRRFHQKKSHQTMLYILCTTAG